MTQDEDHLNAKESLKDFWDILARKGLASGNDRWVTEASVEKANIDELAAERKKDQEIYDRMLAAGDEEGILARMKELEVIHARRWFRIHTWDRLFPSKKQRSS